MAGKIRKLAPIFCGVATGLALNAAIDSWISGPTYVDAVQTASERIALKDDRYKPVKIGNKFSSAIFLYMAQLVKAQYVNPDIAEEKLISNATAGMVDLVVKDSLRNDIIALKKQIETKADRTKTDASLKALKVKIQVLEKSVLDRLAMPDDEAEQFMRAAIDDVKKRKPAAYAGLVRLGFRLDNTARQLIRQYPALKGREQEVIEAGLDGMLRGLDPHSSFFNKETMDEKRQETEGQYKGIGIEIANDRNGVKIQSIHPGSPAERAKIQPGDVFVKIGDLSAEGMTTADVAARLDEQPDTHVTFQLRRAQAAEPFTVTLEREAIASPSVTAAELTDEEGSKIGYITIKDFDDENIPRELTDAFAKLRDARYYIVNLRDNHGGELDNAIAVADSVLDSGEILHISARNPYDSKRYDATPGDLANGKRIAVLINSGSASASEVVAGAWQGNGRADMLGTTSYGKGSVQIVRPFARSHWLFFLDYMIPGGYAHYTTALYFTPKGSIQGVGIVPETEARIPDVGEIERESENANMISNPNLPGVVMEAKPKESCALKPDFKNIGSLQAAFVTRADDGRAVPDVQLLCAAAKLNGKRSHIVEFSPYMTAPAVAAP